jgi:uncharacterized membrane-anchored protein
MLSSSEDLTVVSRAITGADSIANVWRVLLLTAATGYTLSNLIRSKHASGVAGIPTAYTACCCLAEKGKV